MLDWLRKGASGWVAQLFIALLVLSFAIWGVSDIFTGFRSDTIASVGGTDVPIADFQRQYEQAVRQLGQQLGQAVSQENAKALGVPQQVMGRLIGNATLSDAARSLGLGVSNQALAQEIADNPNFHGTSGAFDRNQFTEFLRQNNVNEAQYITQMRADSLRRQIANGLVGGTEVPDAYLKAIHEYRNEVRKVSYLVLTPALIGEIGEPSDSDLTAYFQAHKADWKAPEFRALAMMQMLPADIAKPGEVSDADAKKQYDAQLASRFTKLERRNVDQIVFKDRAEADAAAAALSAGKTFDQLVTERQLKPEDVSLGLVTKDKILDPKVRDAAFGLAANTVSGVIDGGFGPVIVRVTTVEPEVIQTFDQVKDQLKQEIATENAVAEIADQHDVIEDASAAGDSLADIAKKYELKLVTVAAVDKDGNDADGKAIVLPGGKDLLAAAFDTDVGLQNDPVSVDRGFVWYDVTSVAQAHDRELNEVRAKVVDAWKKDQVDQKLTAKANDIRDSLAKGDDIAKLAGDASLEVKTADSLTRETPPAGDLTGPAIVAAFSGPKGHAAVAAGNGDQAKVVLVVTDATVPPYFSGAPDMAQVQQQLSGQMADDLLTQYATELQSQLGFSINQPVLQQLLGEPSS